MASPKNNECKRYHAYEVQTKTNLQAQSTLLDTRILQTETMSKKRNTGAAQECCMQRRNCPTVEDDTARINKIETSLICKTLERSAHASQQDIRLLCFRIIVFRDDMTKHQKMSLTDATVYYLKVSFFVPRPTWRWRV